MSNKQDINIEHHAAIKQIQAEILTKILKLIEQETSSKNIIKSLNNLTDDININDAVDAIRNICETNHSNNIESSKNIALNLNSACDRLLYEHNLLYRQINFLEEIIDSYVNLRDNNQLINVLFKKFYHYIPYEAMAICINDIEDNMLLKIYYTKQLNDQQKIDLVAEIAKKLEQQYNINIELEQVSGELLLSEGEEYDFNLHQIKINNIYLPRKEGDALKTQILTVSCLTTKEFSEYENYILEKNLYIMTMFINANHRVLSTNFMQEQRKTERDVLTGLYNQNYFNRQLENWLDNYKNNDDNFSVLLIDIDDFRTINEKYGHIVGDMVVKNVADIISQVLRKFDIIARVGGDAFAVVLVHIYLSHTLMVAEKIRKQVAETEFSDTKGSKFNISVSIGATNCRKDFATAKDLMTDVDIALYNSKDAGRNKVSLSDSIKAITDDDQANRLEMVKIAMQEDRLMPYFQPIVNNSTMAVYGYEALSRIKDKNGNVITAEAFIDCVEKSSLSHDFHNMMLYKTLKIFKKHISKQKNPTKLFVNLSIAEIQNNFILTDIIQMCNKFSINPNLVVFEFVERTMINNLYSVRRQMAEARKQGFSFAIDDFGTAYNSLSYLKEMQFEYLKIDGAFVKNILYSRTDYILIKNLQNLCKELGIVAIAEFVESEQVRDKLREIKVDYIQGYLVGKPMDLSD